MRRGVIRASIVAVLLGAAGCGSAEGEPDPQKVLSGLVNVGVATDAPGFSNYTTGGVWQGFDISLIRWLGDDIGFTPQFVPMTVNERMIKLIGATKEPEKTAVTIVVANFSMSDDRRRDIDMAGPYFIDAQGFLTLEAKSPTPSTTTPISPSASPLDQRRDHPRSVCVGEVRGWVYRR
jgi:glutamate transport system substrate-binding protein